LLAARPGSAWGSRLVPRREAGGSFLQLWYLQTRLRLLNNPDSLLPWNAGIHPWLQAKLRAEFETAIPKTLGKTCSNRVFPSETTLRVSRPRELAADRSSSSQNMATGPLSNDPESGGGTRLARLSYR